jgi:hypothetical protein
MVQFPIPDAALDDRLAFIGTSGSGKTYNAGGGVERLLQSGARVIIVDPLGVWWGLRLNADGRPSGFTLPIFGGEHGDLPLNEHAGKIIGETVAGMAESCIVDLSGLATKEAERRFMLTFLEAVYRHASGDPVHVVFDEADMWAPQNTGKGAGPQLQALMEQIVRRGRVRGFIPWLITQRPAVLSKDVLSQADGLVAFKLTASQDRAAIGDWVKGQADLERWKEIWAELPTMQRGQGVIWVPARGVLKTVEFPAKATFDSSRTPKRGEKRERRELKPLDLDKLQQRLSSIEQDAKANDPKVLKEEVARLTRELAAAQKKVAAPPPAEKIVANADEISAARDEGQREGIAIGLQRAQEAIAGLGGGTMPVARPARSVAPAARPLPVPIIAAEGLTTPQQRIVNAIAWWKAFGIDRPSNEQVAFIAGYSPGSGGFNNLKGGLRSAGLIDYPAPGSVTLTETGTVKAEVPNVALTREAFHEAVRAKLSGPQWRVLEPALAAYPHSITSDDVAQAAGYSAGSGGYNNLRGSLRTLTLIDYPSPGQVRAADWLFP